MGVRPEKVPLREKEPSGVDSDGKIKNWLVKLIPLRPQLKSSSRGNELKIDPGALSKAASPGGFGLEGDPR